MNSHGEVFIDRKSCKTCESTVKIKKKIMSSFMIMLFESLLGWFCPLGPLLYDTVIMSKAEHWGK